MIGSSSDDRRQRWLFRVQPQPGKSLSSIVERCAAANAVGVRQFLIHLGLPAQGVDLDRVDAGSVPWYEDSMGYRAGALEGTTLSAFVGQTFTRMVQQGTTEWCAGQGLRSKRADAVCVHCLVDGPELYRKLHWRAAYVSRCELHDTDLVDQCPECRGPISTLTEMRDQRSSPRFGRRKDGTAYAWDCLRCGKSCRAPEPPSDAGFRHGAGQSQGWRPYQMAILQAHHGRGLSGADPAESPPWAKLDCGFTYQFLAGVRALLALMHSPVAGHRLRELLSERIGCAPEQLFAGGVRGQPMEVYPVLNRMLALDAIAALLSEGIDRMLETMERAQMTSSTLFLTDRYVPNWLHDPIARHLNGTRYSHSGAEISAALAVARRVRDGSAPGDPQSDAAARTARIAQQGCRVEARALVCKSDVGKLLGSRDSKALDREFGRIRRRYTRAEAEGFFAAAFAAVPQVPVSRTQRQGVIRTLLIMLGVAVSGQAVEEVCGWSTTQVRDMLRDALSELRRVLMAALLASEQGHVRAVLMSRFGARLRGASTRLCASRLLFAHGASGTWNSINALMGTLAPQV